MTAKFDFHVHTMYSDGAGAAAAMVEAAEARGLEGVAPIDHGPELDVGTPRGKLAAPLYATISEVSVYLIPGTPWILLTTVSPSAFRSAASIRATISNLPAVAAAKLTNKNIKIDFE